MTFVAKFRSAAVTIVALFLVGAISFFAMNRVKNEADWIVKDTLTGLSYAGKSASSLTESFNRVLLAVDATTEPERESFLREVDDFNRATAESATNYFLAIYLDQDRQNFLKFSDRLKNYQSLTREVVGLARTNRSQEAQGLIKSQVMPAFRECMAAADKLFSYNVSLGEQRGQQILKSCRRTQFLYAVLGTFLFSAGFALAIFKYVFFPMFREN